MNAFSVLLNSFVIRSALYTLAAGLVLGGAFGAVLSFVAGITSPGADPAMWITGTALLMFLSSAAGAIVGGVVGAIVGAGNGIVTAIITAGAFDPTTGPARYAALTRILVPMATFLECMLIGPPVLIAILGQLLPGSSTDYLQAVIDWIIPAMVATGAALWVNERIVRRYIAQNRAAPATQETLVDSMPG